MPAHDYYVRMLDVYVTLACVMCWYVYRAWLDVERGPIIILYAIAFVIIVYGSMIICLNVYICTGQGSMSGEA